MNELHKTKKSITADKKLKDTTLEDLLRQLNCLDYKKQCNIIKELLNDIGYKQHKDVTIPLKIRLAIYYTAYTYCKENKITSLSRNVSVQSVVLKDLDISNNMFTKWKLTLLCYNKVVTPRPNMI